MGCVLDVIRGVMKSIKRGDVEKVEGICRLHGRGREGEEVGGIPRHSVSMARQIFTLGSSNLVIWSKNWHCVKQGYKKFACKG